MGSLPTALNRGDGEPILLVPLLVLWRAQAIADAGLGQDMRRARRIGFELLAQRADKDAQILHVLACAGPQTSRRIWRWVSTLPACATSSRSRSIFLAATA